MIKEGVYLGKRYEILGRIGSGGMADVYKGKDHKLNRYVAIKVLKSDYRNDQVFIQKFVSEAQAAAIAEESLPQLQACVERTLQEQGSGLSARVYLTEMYFDTTYYEDFTLPAGVYDALRVELGAHAGRNWFCVLYPGLCLPAAGEAAVYPTEAQQDLVEAPRVEVRFAALEWLEHLTGEAGN